MDDWAMTEGLSSALGLDAIDEASSCAMPAASAGGSEGKELAAPRAGINKPGFIDHSDGANLRTGPAEAGGATVRAAPLPPATRVFVSGTHPSAPQFKSAVRDGHDLRYYENVLLKVNRDKGVPGSSAAIRIPASSEAATTTSSWWQDIASGW